MTESNKSLPSRYVQNYLERKSTISSQYRQEIMEEFQSGLPSNKESLLIQIKKEREETLEKIVHEKHFKIKRFIFFTKSAQYDNLLFNLNRFARDNPYSNLQFNNGVLFIAWLQALSIPFFIGSLIFLLYEMGANDKFPINISIYLGCVMAGVIGSWVPYGRVLTDKEYINTDQYILRQNIVTLMLVSIVLSTVVFAFTDCLNKNLVSKIIDTNKWGEFQIVMCAFMGAGDWFIWNIIRKSPFILPGSGGEKKGSSGTDVS